MSSRKEKEVDKKNAGPSSNTQTRRPCSTKYSDGRQCPGNGKLINLTANYSHTPQISFNYFYTLKFRNNLLLYSLDSIIESIIDSIIK